MALTRARLAVLALVGVLLAGGVAFAVTRPAPVDARGVRLAVCNARCDRVADAKSNEGRCRVGPSPCRRRRRRHPRQPVRPLDEPHWSIARRWNEQLLNAIRRALPNPPVHARNLFHLSVAMWDAWAAYNPVASGYLFREKLTAVDIDAARAGGDQLRGLPRPASPLRLRRGR